MVYYGDFSIFITTKDRLPELKYTLNLLEPYLKKGVHLSVCDDGSVDGTYEYLQKFYPSASIFRNEVSKGLIFSRNELLKQVNTKYAISLDDDLNFLTQDPFRIIQSHFEKEKACAVASFRIFWSENQPSTTISKDRPHRVRNYAGGAHAIRMQAWKKIPNYPAWFIFYGEEEFASYHFFKKGWEIHYLPQVLTHHRVNNKERKKNRDYTLRLRRSLRSGWYLYFLFLPWKEIPKKLSYSIWMQLKLKIAGGDLHSLAAMSLALKDVVQNFIKLLKNRSALTQKQFNQYQQLPPVKLYWKPTDEISN
ncbi:glycosyltransferase family 2 protein [Salegentibacter sp. BDJ18]|uniref:glycosyltransferase family 2 protein n=1 Tax=Salegentibacter sp. BDJ18 TaxID=2816376 RepID=UPI001AAF1716|nr:glycosyltransferase family A protein [Salegentibacter sp. BDJ18]MBO2544273.1 glycosyltransferase family 2 protein [Salegentibacter sp. BDJ18]